MAHFYEKTATGVEPRHFVPVQSRHGDLRPSTIRDAKKGGWYASVTTIQGMLDKPGLNNWRIDEHLKQAYKLSGNYDSFEDWCAEVKRNTQEELDRAPQQGTDIHDSLEKWFATDYNVPTEHHIPCKNVRELIAQTFGADTIWHTEKPFVCDMGFAGKCDLSNNSIVLDYKSKNTKDKWKPGKMHYPEMCMQLAAYRYGLGIPNARCFNLFVCIETGETELHEWDDADLERQFANFADLTRIWLRNAQYQPGKPV